MNDLERLTKILDTFEVQIAIPVHVIDLMDPLDAEWLQGLMATSAELISNAVETKFTKELEVEKNKCRLKLVKG